MWAITKPMRPRPVTAMTYLEPSDDRTGRNSRFINNPFGTGRGRSTAPRDRPGPHLRRRSTERCAGASPSRSYSHFSGKFERRAASLWPSAQTLARLSARGLSISCLMTASVHGGAVGREVFMPDLPSISGFSEDGLLRALRGARVAYNGRTLRGTETEDSTRPGESLPRDGVPTRAARGRLRGRRVWSCEQGRMSCCTEFCRWAAALAVVLFVGRGRRRRQACRPRQGQ